MARLWRLLVLVSQAGNVLLFDGNQDETISGRSWREGEIGGDPTWARRRVLIDAVPGAHHCETSYEQDRVSARLILSSKA